MKHILIDLLNSFTKKELKGFENFLHPGFFYIDRKLIRLFNVLKKYSMNVTANHSLIEVRIYNTVFSKHIKTQQLNATQKIQLNALANALRRLAEDYLVYVELQKNNETKRTLLHNALLERNQVKLLQKHIKKDKKKIDYLEKKTEMHYRFLYELENSQFNLMYQKGEINEIDNLALINNNLDISYILEKLSLWISVLSLEQITHRTYDHSNFEIVEKFIEHNYSSHPTINVCITMIHLLRDKTEIQYKKLLRLLDEHFKSIDDKILIAGYNIATNFCSYSIKRGAFTHQDLLKLYQSLDDKNLLIEDGFMPVTKLKNLVAVGCRTSKFKWGKNILEKYIDKVQEKYIKSVYEFNYGIINFYQQKYNAALQHFIRVNDIDFVLDNNYRIMMMKAHYEVDIYYDERTVQIFRSAEKYFAADKLLSNNNRAAYKNFTRMLINLYRIKHKETKMRPQGFLKKLHAQKFNQDKSWLMEKLAELKIVQ